MRPVPLGGLVVQGVAIMTNGVIVTSFGGGLLIIALFFHKMFVEDNDMLTEREYNGNREWKKYFAAA